MYLVNGYWDTNTDSNTVPKIVAEMHNVKLEDLQNTWVNEAGDTFYLNTGMDTQQDPLKHKAEEFTVASPGGSDSGLGSDSPEGNLSWLLNFKLDEIPGLQGTIKKNMVYMFENERMYVCKADDTRTTRYTHTHICVMIKLLFIS